MGMYHNGTVVKIIALKTPRRSFIQPRHPYHRSDMVMDMINTCLYILLSVALIAP